MRGPKRIAVYVCQGCEQWTVYRRRKCAWCEDTRPLITLTYVREGA